MSVKSKKMSLVIMTLLLAASCGNKTESDTLSSSEIKAITKKTPIKTTFVKGSPLGIIKGSTSNPDSFITPTNLEDFSNYSLVGVDQFTEKEEVVVEEEDVDIEAGNEAPEEDQSKKGGQILYSFKQVGSDYIYSSNSDKGLNLSFILKNGKLDLISLNDVYDFKAIHYSQHKSGNAFSIMGTVEDSHEGKVLLSFTFVKKTFQKEIRKTDSKYKYIYGAGIMIPWNQKEVLNVDICGAPSEVVKNIYKDGIAMWNSTLLNRLTIAIRALFTYPPFSDLNTHCIYTVDNYQTEYSENIFNRGTTFSKGNTSEGNIIDADIMIWVKENAKMGKSLDEIDGLTKVVAHEVGHLLGLAHQFDSDTYSIMGYDGVDWITDYDIDVIQ
ncbi:MAG: hypothetical protein Q7U04_09315, partial [Bacteriovorax sp.]|nr:hypothetical protein [Bacteriovorax sp.]